MFPGVRPKLASSKLKISEMAAPDPFKYSKAVVRGIPASLPDAALRQDDTIEPVDLDMARQQHAQYVDVLKTLIPQVIELPADERYPDCVFVEDPVVVCDNTALITIPGHPSRRGEAVALKSTMQELGLHIVEMTDPARMDGGDVLFTGKEFFVGLSKRTNKEGLAQLSTAFPAYPVTPVAVSGGLHLKSFLSMAGPGLMAIGLSEPAHAAKKVIETNGKFTYQFLSCPDDIAANCLYVSGTLVHASRDAFPDSATVYDQLTGNKIALSASELNKVDGCFTCCSVLIR